MLDTVLGIRNAKKKRAMYGSSISDIKAAHTQTNKDVKTQDMIPDSWDIKRSDFRKPRSLNLPGQRNALNSLTSQDIILFIQQSSFDVRTTCPLLQNSI